MDGINLNTTLDEFLLVAPALGRVIDRLGIGSRRDRNRSLDNICQKLGFDPPTFARVLAALAVAEAPTPPVCLDLMTLPDLCDHLEQARQASLQDELARFDELIHAMAERHGEQQPLLLSIRAAFIVLRDSFATHFREEGDVVFPLIRQMATGGTGGRLVRVALKPRLARMQHEHNLAEEALAELGALAGEMALRPPASAALPAVADALVRLEHAVHEQIYHENQVLFPRALAG